MSQGFDPQGGYNSNMQGFNPQGGFQNSQPRPDVSSPMVWSILTTLFCCLPTGIVSIVYASQVNSLLSVGAFQKAQKAAGNAKMWAWISVGLGLVSAFFNVALMLPAISSVRNTAKDLQSGNNLRMVSMAMHNYATVYHDQLPAAYTVDEDGKPLHSWRVAILPYIEEEDLYKQIRLDEPWDSEWNKQFHDKCPKCFQNPNVELAPDETTYAVVVGENTAFPGSKGMNLMAIEDGISNTGMLTERSPVCWMDPNSDIPFEEAIKGVNNSPNGIRSYFVGRFTVVTCDGAVHKISDDVSGDFLRKLFDRQDGEKFDVFESDK